MFRSNPHYRSFGKGLLHPDQVRGQAWSMRTLAHAAYITPDADPMKAYFVERMENNISHYNAMALTGNALGVIPSGIVYATPQGASTGLAPWQDDFFTWAIGYVVELGFDSAKPAFEWKARFPVARMTDRTYCWIDAAVYAMAVRPSATAPLFTTIAEAGAATFKNADGSPWSNSTGAKYADQACGSQAQADWRTQREKDEKTGRSAWLKGEMTGYATSTAGYPSNMQPGLALASGSQAPNARAAWTIFDARPVKPNYSSEPQWDIVPR
jgi:hypothetical protein